jgi:hypothetical protein
MTKAKEDLEQPLGYTYKYKRLYDLGSDRVGIIDSMLTSGDSPSKVAEHIQVEWKQCEAIKTSTLEKQIQRYRADILEPRLIMAAEAAVESGSSMSKAMSAARAQVDVMEEMNNFIVMQGSRIKKAYAKECMKGDNGKLDPVINKELRPFTDMCRVLAGLQLETGVVRRVPKQVQGFFQQLTGDELQEMRMEMTQNDSTLKSLNIIKGVLEDAVKETIDGEHKIPFESSPKQLPECDAEDMEPESH